MTAAHRCARCGRPLGHADVALRSRALPRRQSAAIRANLRRQGVPIEGSDQPLTIEMYVSRCCEVIVNDYEPPAH